MHDLDIDYDVQESEEEITADDWEEFRKREEVERKEREAREALEAKKRREEEKERLEQERREKEREDEASSSSSSSRSRSRSRRKTQWDVADTNLLEAAKAPPLVNPLAPQPQVVQPQVQPPIVPAMQVQPPPPPAPVPPQPPEPGAFAPNGHVPGVGCQGLYQPMQAMQRPMLPVQPLAMQAGHMQAMPLPLQAIPVMQPRMLQQTHLPTMHQSQLQPMQAMQLPGLQQLPMQAVRPAWGAWQAPSPVAAVPFQATEDRWMGRIKRYQDGPMGGYGFIDCDDLKLRYGRDVYIHKHQMAGLQIGDEVSFTIALNSKGEPQARNVIKASEALRGPVEPDPNLMDEQHARQFQASLRGV